MEELTLTRCPLPTSSTSDDCQKRQHGTFLLQEVGGAWTERYTYVSMYACIYIYTYSVYIYIYIYVQEQQLFLLKTASSFGLTAQKKERKQDCPHVDHNQLSTLYHSKSHIAIVLVSVVAQALLDFRTSTILVYMILNGKGWLTGCALHGYSLVSVPFLTSQPIELAVFNKNIFACFKCISCLFVCLFYCLCIS